MRIEKRGDSEYLVGAPDKCDGCNDVHVVGGPCCDHLNGEHLAATCPRGDGACEILARWPIERASSAAALRSADEIAREMVPDARRDGAESCWRSCVRDEADYVPLEPQPDELTAQQIVADARALIVRMIERWQRAERSER
jgi:hypothetical protein